MGHLLSLGSESGQTVKTTAKSSWQLPVCVCFGQSYQVAQATLTLSSWLPLSLSFSFVLIFEKDLKFFVLSTSVFTCMYVYASHVCSTGETRTSGAGVIVTVSYHVGPGNGAQVLCKSCQRS